MSVLEQFVLGLVMFIIIIWGVLVNIEIFYTNFSCVHGYIRRKNCKECSKKSIFGS